MRLILVRHGKTESFKQGLYAGSIDTPLSDEGIKELQELATQTKYPESDFYLTSGMLRANQTFETLYPKVKLDGFFEAFKERDGGILEGTRLQEDKTIYKMWLNNNPHDGEESFEQFSSRVIEGLKQLCIKYQDQTVTIVCHAGIVQIIYAHFKKVDPKRLYELKIKHGGAYIFDVNYVRNELILRDFDTLDHEPLYHFDKFKLVLIRHGKTDGNTAKVLTGCDHEYMLTEEGINQLKEYSKVVDYPKTDMYFTTTLQRTQDTFHILYPNAIIDGKLNKCREVSFGRYDGTPISTISINDLFNTWLKDDHDMGFERFYKLEERCMDGVVDIMDECGDKGYNSATLVCHMGTMRAILIYLEKINQMTYMQIQANNGGGHVLEMCYDDKGYHVLSDTDI